VLSFLAKQVGVSVVVMASLAVAVQHGWRRGLGTALLGAGGVLLAIYALSVSSHGWYEYYAFELPAAHGRGPLSSGLEYLLQEVVYVVPVSVVAVVWAVRTAGEHRQRFAWLVCVLGGFFPACFASRVHDGGSLNTWIPLWLGLSLLVATSGMGDTWLRKTTSPLTEPSSGVPSSSLRGWLVSGLLVAQLGWMSSHFRQVDLPSRRAEQHALEFLKRVSEMPGKVWVTHHGGLTTQLGKPHFAHAMALVDVFKTRADVRGQKAKLHRHIIASCRKRRFDRVVSSSERRLPFFRALKRCLPKHTKIKSKFYARVVPRGALSPNQLLWR